MHVKRPTNSDAMTNIEGSTTEDLQKLRDDIDAELRRRAVKQRAEARKQIMEIAKNHEIDLAELASAKSAARYRNPDNQFDVWTGKGRQPKWVKAHLANGRTLADLEIA